MPPLLQQLRYPGWAVQVDPIKPTLKPPGTKLLKLKYDEPPSNFAFKSNLRRYVQVWYPVPFMRRVPLNAAR